ncbi:uncharacterized protein LOC129228185 [Uloborus diversus]|uniref:uncharacterized protein LOC129228185 n=1 Tax=Uloborus diversus TaxID=327109 RepID=UPI002409CCDA|nr:uncharacterized protein LOC129228185 [Uloborus diversus]
MKGLIVFAEVFLVLMLYYSTSFSQAQEDNREIKEEELYLCFYAILCTERDVWAFKDVADNAGPGLHAKVLEWFYDICGIEAEDTPEFWESYPDIKCAQSEEQKRYSFEEFTRRCGEYWADVCEDQESEECIKTGEAAVRFEEVIGVYTAKGTCTNEAVHAAEVGAEKAGEMAEGMAEEGMDQFKNAEKSFPAKW